MNIGVTSNSKIKLDAVKEAYHFYHTSPKISGYSSNSGIGEQPVNEDTLKGARNRINYVKNKTKISFDYI